MLTEEEIVPAIFLIKSGAMDQLAIILHCCSCIVPIILHLVNFCIETGCFPMCWENLYLLPLPQTKNPVEMKDFFY